MTPKSDTVWTLTANGQEIPDADALLDAIGKKPLGADSIAAWIAISTAPVIQTLLDTVEFTAAKNGDAYRTMTGEAIKEACKLARKMVEITATAQVEKDLALMAYERAVQPLKAEIENLMTSYKTKTGTKSYNVSSLDLAPANFSAKPEPGKTPPTTPAKTHGK